MFTQLVYLVITKNKPYMPAGMEVFYCCIDFPPVSKFVSHNSGNANRMLGVCAVSSAWPEALFLPTFNWHFNFSSQRAEVSVQLGWPLNLLMSSLSSALCCLCALLCVRTTTTVAQRKPLEIIGFRAQWCCCHIWKPFYTSCERDTLAYTC